MLPSPILPPKANFYRKPLPETCISFSSEAGKQLFKEALLTGHLACYFKLASQFRTQDEPAFCGLSTLVMVLNALEVDPGQIWKGPWRWYHENMLDCCTPLEIVEQNGINIYQFICIAHCNNLSVMSKKVDELADVNDFRNAVKAYTQQDDAFIVASYSRSVLKQTGDGHFSPIGGYHPEKDVVLLMDTARFKYPPHWISVPLLFEAMKAKDKETGHPRGYMFLSRRKESGQLLLLRVPDILSVTSVTNLPPDIFNFLELWEKYLKTPVELHSNLSDITLIDTVLAHLSNCSKVLEPNHAMLSLLTTDKENSASVSKIITELESIELFSLVVAYLSHKDPGGFVKLFNNVPNNIGNDFIAFIRLEHFLAFFLLSWPYSCAICNTGDNIIAGEMTKYVNTVLASKINFLQHEVMVFRSQIETILDFNNNKRTNSKCCKIFCTNKPLIQT